MKTITILGTDYDGCEVIRQGDDWGIKTAVRIFWLLPLFDGEGNVPPKLPPYPPRAVQRMTHVIPDLTADHPETVTQLLDKDRAYYDATTWEAHCAEFPDDVRFGQEAFEKAKQEVLTATLEEFARTAGTRSHVWAKHGSDRLAAELGFLGHWPEAPTLACGHGTFVALLKRRQRMRADEAEAMVGRIKYVVLYNGEAGDRKVYLEGIVEAPVASAFAPEKAPATKEELAALATAVAGVPHQLETIRTTGEETHQRVLTLEAKKKGHTKAIAGQAGAATFFLADFPQEARELRAYMRRVRKNWISEHGKYRARNTAIAAGRSWWATKFKDAEFADRLREDQVSDNTLGNFLEGKTGKILKVRKSKL